MVEREQAGRLLLPGLDGGNLLAFLAALGTLRGLAVVWPNRRVRLFWVRRDVWRPALQVAEGVLGQDEVLDGLERFFEMRPGHEVLNIGDNLNVSPDQFRRHAQAAAQTASPSLTARAMSDFVASFACEVLEDGAGRVRDTAFRTMSGAGHQHFLKTMRNLAIRTTRDSVQRCLFGQWARQDEQLSLRWDAEDDRRYALRWRDPSKEVTRTEWGANRLAYEALPLFPVAPVGGTLATTGFSGRGSRDTFFTWPIWEAPIEVQTVRSLLALRGLQDERPDRAALAARGVVEVYRSQRITVDKYRNFCPARPV